MILTVNSSVEGGRNSGPAQRPPVSQGNTLLSAVTVNIFSPEINFLHLHFLSFFL